MSTTSEPRWLALMREEAARTDNASLAKRLGYSRTTISLVLKGSYPGSTEKVAARALEVLEPVLVVACHYLGEEITTERCAGYSSQRAPTHHPTKMNHWRACQQCPNKCKGSTK